MSLEADEPAGAVFATLAGVVAALGPGSMEAALGVRPLSARPGRSLFELALGPGMLRADGTPDPLVVAVLADCGSGVPVFSVAPGLAAGVTVELRVDHVGPVSPGARLLRAEGRPLRAGPEGGQGAVTISDERGGVVALATAVMAGFGPTGEMDRAPVPLGRTVPLPYDGLGPETDDGAAVAVGPHLCNSFGALHGGVVMAAMQSHQERLLRAAGRSDRHTSIAVEYLRPALGEGLWVRTVPARRGARFWSLDSEITAPDGRVLARAHGVTTAADLG
jgi:acyl-coenzyme A thioesterase PaaI-like protein